ncbi:MAG: DNA recombination protein RmuC [Bacteroidota bacterium]
MEAMLLAGLCAGVAVAGVAVGGTVAWLLSAARTRSAIEPGLRALETRAGAATATADELRRQVAAWQQRVDDAEGELRRLEGEKAAGAARTAEIERGLVEQTRMLDAAKDQLATTFQVVAAETLRKSNEGFLQLANEKLSAARREGSSELEAREKAIAALVAPVKQSLDKFDLHVHALEQVRGEAYVRLTEQVRSLADGQQQLRSGTEQQTVTTADGRVRPDVIVRLPGDKRVVVDAKAPLMAFLTAVEAKSEDERAAHMRQHAEQVRAHVIKLGAKSYWDQIAGSPELVVMFLPGDAFYAAALEQLPDLWEEAVANRVLIATPMTLIAVLQAVHVGWKEQRLAANAEEISRCGRDLHERIATLSEHIAKVGAALGRTVDAFNHAAGSFENRVLPGARKLEELGAAGKKGLPDVEPVDTRPRALMSSLPADSPRSHGAAAPPSTDHLGPPS